MKHIILQKLDEDVRFQEALSSCMNCGVCTAICPAAEFFKFDRRVICITVQSRNVEEIEKLLKSDIIWYCGQCMSCKTRCPRGNVAGGIITVLRRISQELGYFTESEKGRQQLAIERTLGQNILESGYCVSPDLVVPDLHPEQGPNWNWFCKNIYEVAPRFGAVYKEEKAGALRKIKEEDLDEVRRIFDVTGGTDLFNQIENCSHKVADSLNVHFGKDYFKKVYSENSGTHTKDL